MRVIKIPTTTYCGVAVVLGLILPSPRGRATQQESSVPVAAAFEVAGRSAVNAAGDGRLIANDEAVFIVDEQAGVIAFAKDASTRLWAAELPASAAAVGSSLLAVYSGESLHALDAKTGAVRWSVPLELPPSSLVVTDAVVLAATGTALRAWNLDGRPAWDAPLTAAPVSVAVAVPDRLFVATADRSLARFDLATGAKRWSVTVDSEPRKMTAAGDELFFGSADGAVYAYRQDGSPDPIWRYPIRSEPIGAPVVDDRCVYVTSMDNALRGFKRSIGNVCWSPFQLNDRPATGAVIAGGDLVVATTTGTLLAVKAATGRQSGAPTPAPNATANAPARLLASAAAPDGLTIYTLTVASESSPTLAAFRRSK